MDYAALEKFLSPKVNEFKNNPKELEKVLEELLEKLIAPDSVSGLGCDNMSVILISLKH